MVNPFGLEVIANPDLLPFERSFVAAHEWGHLAGYASEAEANFFGWLTCVRASPRPQYSAWFYLYWQISSEVNREERAKLSAALADGPRRDINAVIARLRGGEIPALQRASWQVYDKYLKANRVEAGVRSYGEVSLFFCALVLDRGGRRFVVLRRRQPRPRRELTLRIRYHDRARAFASHFVRRQAAALNVMILVHLVLFAHKNPQGASPPPVFRF